MPGASRRGRPHLAVAALGLVVATTLAACGGGSSQVSSKPKSTTTTTTTTTAPPATAVPGTPSPVVLKFASDQAQVACSGSKASSLTLTWLTENATTVTLRIDGPTVFNTYPPSSSVIVPYSCPAPQHTYLLTANGVNGQTSSQAITVRTLPAPPPPTSPPTAPPTTTAPTTPTTPPTTTAPTTPTTPPTTAPSVTPVSADFTSPALRVFALSVKPASSSGATVEFTVKNSSDVVQDFVVLKTDTPYDQLPVDPVTHKVSEEGKVGEITRIDRDQTKTLRLTLQTGPYVLLANEPFHYSRGARAPFVVLVTTPTS